MATISRQKLESVSQKNKANGHLLSRAVAPRVDVPRPHLWTKKQYHKMAEMGWFEGQHVELIEGEIVTTSPMNSPHMISLTLVAKEFERVFAIGFFVRVQGPLAFPNSEPEPDVAVIPGVIRDYSVAHPVTAALVVEVSDSTLAFDRTRKAALYARAGIAEYWIVNLKKRQLEVHRAPSEDGYADVQIVKSKDAVSPLAAPDARIKIADLLP